ncbi:hypothetical protein F5Y19DRAFT_461836 [Xylariaceae sp. FL1651]|nr:hypothetical protein F5Y19DRAFT_461836 [Xylariaceae sp. FL1651]
MDEYLFSEHLAVLKARPEPMNYLEILNYQGSLRSSAKTQSLNSNDFENFLDRKGPFLPVAEEAKSPFLNGIRLVAQLDVEEPDTFASDVVSLEVTMYESLIRKMRLPLQCLEASTAVGPFFWWSLDMDSPNPQLQFIFRKSDVQWKGTSRGWEMMITYCFKSRITSGYVKGTKSAKIRRLLQQLTVCARPVAHPLLLPILVLTNELSAKNDQEQRDARERIRKLEGALSQRYQMIPAIGYGPDEEIDLDSLNRQLTDCQCKVLQKKPQAWRNALNRVEKAMHSFWAALQGQCQQGEPNKELQTLHRCLLDRLDFLTVKLEGIESYAHVSLERLKNQREVMLSMLDQRESRLSLRIAAQQHRLADASQRDSTSMKTLTFLGSLFLPGTFVSSVFSMSFFDFSKDLQYSASSSIWLYFVLMVPLTVVFVGGWWRFDQARCKNVDEEEENEDEMRMRELENHIMKALQKRTGARFSWNINHL